MADTAISQLPLAAALGGTEIVPIDQGTPSRTVRTTVAAIAALTGGGGGSVTHNTGPLVPGRVVVAAGAADIITDNYQLSGGLAQAYNLPPFSDSIVGAAATQTLSNKRITARTVSTTANAAAVVINTDITDVYEVLNQVVPITSITTTGTPADNDALIIEFTGASAVALSGWGPTFEAGASALPTTTVAGQMLTVGFLFNGATSKWRCNSGTAASFPTTITGTAILPRVNSTSANSAAPVINVDTTDIFKVLGQSVAITGPVITGTPHDGQSFILEVTGTAAVALAFPTYFEPSTVAFPTTTVGTAMLAMLFIYHLETALWRLVAVA